MQSSVTWRHEYLSLVLTALLITIFGLGQQAKAIDSSTEDALKDTQKVMNDPAARNEILKQDNRAKAANDSAAELAGNPENLNQMYNISSELMEYLVKQSNGDMTALTKLIGEIEKDPKKFMESLPEEYQTKIRALASKVPPPKGP